MNFFLLVLRILFNFSPDVGHKCGRFSKTLSKKGLEFILYRKNTTVVLNLSLMLLLVEIDFILKKQGCKRDALLAYSTGYVKIVLILLTKVVTFYM